MKNCLTCEFNKNPDKVPGGLIKEYRYWNLQHIDEPIPVLGWLVLKTKRHIEGITGMNRDEAAELGEILAEVPKIQQKLCEAARIYVLCFTELVSHLHIHLIPRHINETKKGPELFGLLDEARKNPDKAINREEAIKLANSLREKLSK